MFPSILFLFGCFFAFHTVVVSARYAGNQAHVPEWFRDGIFGIFIHYGVYTVPAYAPLTDPYAYGSTTLADILSDKPYPAIVNNTYAQWYWNSMSIPGSATYQYHQKTYGNNFTYDDFFPVFQQESTKVNVNHWKEVIQSARANYAVLTSVHHEGYNIFPSKVINPHRNVTSIARDILGEFMTSLRTCNPALATGPGNYCAEPGVYVSTGYRWEFNGVGFSSVKASLEHVLQTPEYSTYLRAQFDQLIRDYKPSYFWGDWGAPQNFDLDGMLSQMDTNVGAKAMINDRFTQTPVQSFFNLLPAWISSPLRDLAKERFNTLSWEYKNLSTIINYSDYHFEMTRGIARDFSYNLNETPDDPYLLRPQDILEILLMTSANNGNFLLGITPMADGTVPAHQVTILQETGKYLDIYGEAIFKTRPCAASDPILRLALTNNDKANYGRFCTKSAVTANTYYLTYIQYHTNENGLSEFCVPPLSSIHTLFVLSYASTKVTNLATGEVMKAKYSWTTTQFCIPLPTDRSMPVTIKIQKK